MTTTADRTAATHRDSPVRPVHRRRGVPARVLIMGWLLLLMAVVLAAICLMTRNILHGHVYEEINTALEQEVREFTEVAEGGVDQSTRQPFDSVEDLLRSHLQLQYPDDDEVIVGWLAEPGVPGGQVLRQNREAPLPLHDRNDLLRPILDSSDSSGVTATEIGDLHWVKVITTKPAPDTEPQRGAYLVGYFADRDLAEADATIRTLALVSLLGLVFAGAAAWIVAGQILSPVRLVRQAAAEITEQDLTGRISVTGRDDISALAEQFNAMLDRLELAFATQREFLDDASHELRTPITIIRGHLELMDYGDDPADLVDRTEVVRLCTDELDRMSRIVDDLLLLAKAERPDFVRPEPIELAELTSDVDAKVRALGDRTWRLETIGTGTVVVDPQRVTQAVVQLAHNAVQHTQPGDTILLGSSRHQGQVSLWVTDTGPGVREAEQDLIFERFSRGSARGHRGGAGLGLAIVRAIAEAHHGTVRLMSTPGAGATFGIELPTTGGVHP